MSGIVFGLVLSLTQPNLGLLEPKKIPKIKSDFDLFYSKIKQGFIVLDKPCIYPSSKSRFCGAYKDVDKDNNRELLITFTIRF